MQKNVLKFIFLLTLTVLFYSCSNIGTYTRHTDLHDVKLQRITLNESIKDSIDILYYRTEGDTIAFRRFSKKESPITYLKGKKVILMDSSYYIRSDVEKPKIHQTYFNRDVKF